MVLGALRSYETQQSSLRMYEADNVSRKKQPTRIPLLPLVMLIRICGPRRGMLNNRAKSFVSKRSFGRLEEEIARMKKNQERRLHRKNAKIVKEGGTPMTLNRPIKPDTTVRMLLHLTSKALISTNQRRCGHCGQMGHMSKLIYLSMKTLLTLFCDLETNRKCPRWAEFNSGTVPAAPTPSGSGSMSSPPPPSATIPPIPGGFGRPGGSSAFGHPVAVSSPLATSPPMTAMDEDVMSATSAPKIKLALKRT